MCLAYLEHFGDRAQAVVQHPRYRRIFDRRASRDLFEILATSRTSVRRGLVKSILRSAASRKVAAKDRLYLNIGHTGLDDPGFASWVASAGVRPVYFVHDLIPITHPEYCRAGERERHVKRMRTILTTASGVIGNSQVTLDDLADFGRANGLASPPDVAAWLGKAEHPNPVKKPAPGRPTFVVLGTIEARKNHLMLLQVWQRLIRRLGDDAPKLLIIGQRGWECEQVFDLLDRGDLKAAVTELGNCSDDELFGYLANARALLFPSLVEGYGLPLIEALDAGAPVIASNLPVFREIGDGVPEFLDPLDGPAWENAILSYSTDGNGPRENQLKRLRSYHAPTWETHFSKVEAWMGRL